jgi:hypothetical protein
MNTKCPCPQPPGGSVTCEGHQFAYCHVIGGKVQSGCIPIPPTQAARPTLDTMLPLFWDTVTSAGFKNLSGRYLFSSSDGDSASPPWRIKPGSLDASRFLFDSMDEGSVIVLTDRDASSPLGEVLLIRFPHIWSRFGSEAQSTTKAQW